MSDTEVLNAVAAAARHAARKSQHKTVFEALYVFADALDPPPKPPNPVAMLLLATDVIAQLLPPDGTTVSGYTRDEILTKLRDTAAALRKT